MLGTHTISLRVTNQPGVLIRVALVFSRRGYNIESLVVSPAQDRHFSNMNIVVKGDSRGLDQVLKQLNKLVDVLHATDRVEQNIITREMALYKVVCEERERSAILQLAHALKCDIIEVGANHLIVEATGKSERLDNIQALLNTYEVVEIIRTGKLFMASSRDMTP